MADTVAFQVGGLGAGTTYAVAVSSVNQEGFESDCATETTAVARADFTVTPSQLDFGSTFVGTIMECCSSAHRPSG